MCDTNAFLAKADGKEELVLESITLLRPQAEGVYMKNLFGQELVVEGRLREVSFQRNRVVIEPLA